MYSPPLSAWNSCILKRKQRQNLLNGGQHKRFTNSFNGHNYLKLRDGIYGVNMVNSLTFVLIALMDKVNADIAWLVIGAMLSSNSDLDLLWPSFR
jgi:hypothetical protein